MFFVLGANSAPAPRIVRAADLRADEPAQLRRRPASSFELS
jgi:hypothetical protein